MGWLKTPLVLVGFICTFPLMALTWIAPVVSIVWLLILGKWGLLVFGVILSFIAPTLIALVVGGGLGVLTALKVPRAVLRVGAWLLQLLTFALVVLYGIWVFALALQHRDHGNIWPYLLWAYGTGVTPWQAIASKAPAADPGAVIWCSTAQFGGAGMLIALACGLYYGSGLYFILGALFGAAIGYAMTDDRSTRRPMFKVLKSAQG